MILYWSKKSKKINSQNGRTFVPKDFRAKDLVYLDFQKLFSKFSWGYQFERSQFA